MMVQVLPVRTSRQQKEFLYLPERLPNGRPSYVPPIWMDEKSFYSTAKNPAYAVCRTERWLAYRGDSLVGRIMGIIHDEYNEREGEKTARFYALECINDQEVAHKLLSAAESWARENGMNRIIGPFGFSDKDPEGLQIEGLEYRPVISTANNAAYLEKLVVNESYEKLTDCVVYRLDVPATTPAIFIRAARLVSLKMNVQQHNFTSTRQLKPYVIPIFRLINETYKDLLGFVPLTDQEMKKLANQYLPLLDPHFVKAITDERNNLIAFIVAVPDFSEGLKKAKGKLFPFGFIRLFASMKKTQQLNMLLGAVHPDYQGKGLTALLGIDLFDAARKRKFTFCDSHLILETNTKMRGEMERIGGKVYKRYRIYQKTL